MAKLVPYSTPPSDLDALSTHHISSGVPLNPRTDGQSGVLVRFLANSEYASKLCFGPWNTEPLVVGEILSHTVGSRCVT